MSKQINKHKLVLAWLWIAASAFIIAAQTGGNYTISQSVVASGGGQNSSGAGYIVDGTIGQTGAGTNSGGGNYNLRGGFWAAETFAPTAAQTTVGGRVLTAGGSGIRNVRLTLTAPNGETRTVQTSSFGYYRFEEVPVGETYVISVASKRFTFNTPTVVRTIFEEIADLDFIAFEP